MKGEYDVHTEVLDMEYQDHWKVFERTGSIKDYLHYVLSSAGDELAAGREEEVGKQGGLDCERRSDSHGHGGLRHTHWRI